MRRIGMAGVAVAIAWCVALASWATPALARDEAQFFDRVYMGAEEAVRLQKDAEADRAEERRLTLSAEDVERVRKERRVRMFTDAYRVWAIVRPGEDRPYRYAIFLQEPGQHEYMDLMVGVDADGTIHRVDLLVYREPFGGEVQGRRFMDQFRGKSHGSALRVNRDIVHIAGATISAHSVSSAARRALGILRLKGLIP